MKKIEFESLFLESKGQPIMYNGKLLKMMDRIILPTINSYLKLTFINTNSVWKQGIYLDTNGEFEINGEKFPKRIALWEHTAPKEVGLTVKSKDMQLIIFNVWETEDGTIHHWHNGGAMQIEEKQNCRIYNCNDGYPDDDFNDIIFKIDF